MGRVGTCRQGVCKCGGPCAVVEIDVLRIVQSYSMYVCVCVCVSVYKANGTRFQKAALALLT